MALTLDQVLPPVRRLARRKAGAFVQRCRLTIDEREDVESQLLLKFIVRWPKFDSEKASVQTFASRLMDKELTSILRYRLALSRQVRELPVPDTHPSAEAIHRFHFDLERALAPLPNIVWETVHVLSRGSTVDAASELRCSRQIISRRKRQIRDALGVAGITPTYFARGGSRQ
jgi:hypothetical protein